MNTHNIRVEGLHIYVSDGAAGQRPHLGFVFEGSSDLQKQLRNNDDKLLTSGLKMDTNFTGNHNSIIANSIGK